MKFESTSWEAFTNLWGSWRITWIIIPKLIWALFFFWFWFCETGSHYVAMLFRLPWTHYWPQTYTNPPASACQSAGITHVCHHARLYLELLKQMTLSMIFSDAQQGLGHPRKRLNEGSCFLDNLTFWPGWRKWMIRKAESKLFPRSSPLIAL